MATGIEVERPANEANRAPASRLSGGLLDWAPQLSRYTIVSALALGLDFVVYLSLASLGMRPATAGVIGYLGGGIVHYVLSVLFVFDIANQQKTTARRLGEFFVSGLVGLAITFAIIAFANEALHLPPLPSKIAAVGVSFVAVFLIRRGIVFADMPASDTR
jgi:putative flippase GtrA